MRSRPRTPRAFCAATALALLLMLSVLPASALAQNPAEPGPAPVPAPENVLRLRADQGVTGTSEVTDWADQSGQGNDAATSGLTGPQFVTGLAGLNGQPALLFDRANDEALNVPDTDDINTDPAGYTQRSFTLAFRTGSDVSTRQVLYEEGGSVNGFNIYLDGGTLVASAWSENAGWSDQFSISNPVSANTSYVVTFVFDSTVSEQLQLFVGGTSVGTVSDPSITTMDTHSGDIAIGNVLNDTQFGGSPVTEIDGSGGEGFTGHIAEVILSNQALNTAQRQILESDLSERYAVTIAGDRYGFPNALGEIRGIGQAADGTRQTEAASGRLSFAAPVFAGTDFALVGHNENAESFISDTDPTDIGERLGRVWRYDETGSPSFDLAFDVSGFPSLASGQTYELLVADDETFSSAATVVGGTLSGNTFTVPASNLSSLGDGNYLTLAKTATSGLSALSYSPSPLADVQSNLPITATATASGASGSVAYTIRAGSDDTNGSDTVTYGPNDDGTTENIEIDPGTGAITVTSGTPVGEYTATVEATDNSGTVTFTDVLTIAVQAQVALSYDVPTQAVPPATAIQTTAPAPQAVADGSVSYSLVVDELTAAGLAFDASTGAISGTPTQNGLIRAVVQATGSGAATGTATAEVHIAVVGGDGPAGVGDDVSTILDLDASRLTVEEGTAITTWTDGAAYGNDASAGSATYRGAVVGMNDRPALDFDGGSSFAISNNAQFNNGGEPYVQRSLAMAFRTGSALPGTTPEGLYAEGGGTRGISVYLRNGDLYVGMWNEADANDDDDTTPWGPHFFSAETNAGDGGTGTVSIDEETTYVVTFTYNYAENIIAAYVNGTLIGTETGPSDGSGAGVGRFFDHNDVDIGGSGTQSLDYDGGNEGTYTTFTGEIGEVVAYGVALTDAQRQLLESSLGAKYGVVNGSGTDIGLAQSQFDFTGTEEFDSGIDVVGAGNLSGNPAPHNPDVTSGILQLTNIASFAEGDFTTIGRSSGRVRFVRDSEIPAADDSDSNNSDDDSVLSRLEQVWRLDLNGGSVPFDLVADVSGLSLSTDQEFVLVVDDDGSIDDTNGGATVIRPSSSGSGIRTWTRTDLSAVADGDYLTLGRTVGQASAPTNLTYTPSPLRIATDAAAAETSTPSFDGGQPVPTFTIASSTPNALPTGITLDANSGVVTVNTSVPKGTYVLDIEADNGAGSAATTSLTVEVFEPLTNLTYARAVQTVSLGEAMAPATPTTTPSGIANGTVTYGLTRVLVDGTEQSDLSGTGLSLNTASGAVSGTLSSAGTVLAIVEATGSGEAGGTVTDEVKVTAVGGTGLAGIGDDTTTLLQLTSDAFFGQADAAEIALWTDASAYSNDATQTTSSQRPTLTQDVLNGQPVLTFDGSDDEFEIANDASLNTGGEPYLQRAKTVVFRTSGNLSGRQVLYEEGGGTRGFNLYLDGGTLYAAGWNNADDNFDDLPGSSGPDPTAPWEDDANDGFVFVDTPVQANTAYVATLFYDSSERTIALWVNGRSIGNAPGAGRQYNHGGGIRIGQDESSYDQNGATNAGDPFTGDIAALSFTNASLNEVQRTLLHNALAAQYGIPLDTGNGASDVYAGDDAGSGDYDLGVFGVGQIDAANRHTVAAKDGLQFSNTSGLDDGDYLVAGHRTQGNSATASDISGISGSDVERMRRTWYIDRASDTGASISTDVAFDISESGLNGTPANAANYLLIARTADASAGTAWTTLQAGADAIDGDVVRFTGVTLGNATEITLGTANALDSPISSTALTITGTAGNEGTAANGTLGGDAGWRMVGPPVAGASVGNIISGVRSPFIFNEITQGDQLYRWDDTNGAWEVLREDTDPFDSGRGHILFLFDDDEGPIAPNLTIDVDAGTVPTTDQTVPVAQNAQFHLLANPFNQAYDLASLQNSGGTAIASGGTGFNTTVQIWNGGSTSGERGSTQGSYEMVDISTSADAALAPGGRLISAWQGFFVERTSPGTGDTELTFDASGQTSAERSIIGSNAETPAEDVLAARMGLEMTVVDEQGTQVARDAAASVIWHENATDGWDVFDATKLTPLLSRYATIGPVGSARNGTAIKAQESRPWPQTNTPVTVPLDLEATSGLAGTATLQARTWNGIPDTWEITLVDTKGTADPADDVSVAWGEGAAYAFTLGTSATRGRTTTSDTTEAATKAASLAGRGPDTEAQRTPPRLTALNAARSAAMRSYRAEAPAEASPSGAAAQAAPNADTAPPRFVLEVIPEGAPLPVELADVTVQTDGQRARLQWTTASETNNAGFYVQMQPLAAGDSLRQSGRWRELGFVEGAGTTDAPQSYTFETDALEYGRHAFRLRQVDTDGTETLSAPVELDVQLQQAYAIEAPYPNPAQGPVTLPVTVRETQEVVVHVYDLLGRRVTTAYRGRVQGQDTQKLQLDTGQLASGTYFVRIRGEHFATTERLTVVR